ncbi:hypothetical protein IF2G_10561 [Cordyceps javanica]|nr:hypothetical protein IF2G_10561 [Cordyceps javanica]
MTSYTARIGTVRLPFRDTPTTQRTALECHRQPSRCWPWMINHHFAKLTCACNMLITFQKAKFGRVTRILPRRTDRV